MRPAVGHGHVASGAPVCGPSGTCGEEHATLPDQSGKGTCMKRFALFLITNRSENRHNLYPCSLTLYAGGGDGPGVGADGRGRPASQGLCVPALRVVLPRRVLRGKRKSVFSAFISLPRNTFIEAQRPYLSSSPNSATMGVTSSPSTWAGRGTWTAC